MTAKPTIPKIADTLSSNVVPSHSTSLGTIESLIPLVKCNNDQGYLLFSKSTVKQSNCTFKELVN